MVIIIIIIINSLQRKKFSTKEEGDENVYLSLRPRNYRVMSAWACHWPWEQSQKDKEGGREWKNYIGTLLSPDHCVLMIVITISRKIMEKGRGKKSLEKEIIVCAECVYKLEYCILLPRTQIHPQLVRARLQTHVNIGSRVRDFTRPSVILTKNNTSNDPYQSSELNVLMMKHEHSFSRTHINPFRHVSFNVRVYS